MRTPPRSVPDETAFLDVARHYWHPLLRGEDLVPTEVRGVRLLDEDLVVWRTADGSVCVADDICAHRGTMLSAGGSVTSGGALACPYHAWEYAGDGRCVRIPQLSDQRPASKVAIPAYRVKEYAGLIWTCLADEEVRPLPEVPMAGADGWWLHAGTPQTWRCQAPRMVENFLDVAHFGVLHAGNFGNPDVELVEPYAVEARPEEHALSYTFPYLTRDRWSPPVDGKPATRLVNYEYRVELPFAAWIKSTGVRDTPYYTYIAVRPTSPQETEIFWVVTFPDTLVYTEEELDAGFLPFFEEDQRIVEQQRPEWLPLDLGIELHMPFDRVCVAYRTALQRLGFPVLSFPRARREVAP